jgi:hypothetical protein
MAGFLRGLTRLIKGEPVFDPNDQNKGWNDKNGDPSQPIPGAEPTEGQQPLPAQPQAPRTTVVKGQASTFPVVFVRRTRAHSNGSNMDVYCSIRNNSKGPVEVEEINLAGRSRRMGGYLRAGEEREWLCYSGPRLKSEAYKEASLNYKDELGDYFQSIYDVEYQLESDKTYSVEELHLRLPIRDIFG